ncbi:MAG: hypothetical protein R3A10_16465 [Caldilineaceae bacterium]
MADATLVYMVEVSIDGGPWDMAGMAGTPLALSVDAGRRGRRHAT